MPCAQLVLLGGLPGANDVAQRLVRGIGYPDRRKVSATVAACQLEGVAPVGLDPVFTGTSVGATTSHLTPSSASCQQST